MSDQRKKQRPRIGIGAAAMVLGAYIASVGPAYRAAGEATLTHPAYAPLMAASQFPPIGHATVWYLNRWSNNDGFATYGDRLDGAGGAVLFFKLDIHCGSAPPNTGD